MASLGDTTDGMRKGANPTLTHLQISGFTQRLDLYAQITTRGLCDLTEIHEVGILQTIKSHHDLQAQFVVEQRIDNGKLKTHNSLHNDYTDDQG